MKNTIKEDIPILFIFLVKSMTVYILFLFFNMKNNKKYIFIPFILRVYSLKWTMKRSNFYEGLMICRFGCNFDWLERDKSKFDWRKYTKYTWTNIFVFRTGNQKFVTQSGRRIYSPSLVKRSMSKNMLKIT